jgi:glycosyltransferase involved in cell wall biosynthesis
MNQETAQQRKKVLFVITKSNFGGAQRYVYDLATNLPKDHFEVAVAFGGTGTIGSAPGSLASMLADAGVRTITVPELARDINIKLETQAFFALIRLFKREQPDVVHLNSSKVGGLGALAARFARVPHIIYTAHGWYFWEPRIAPVRALTYLLSYITVLLSHHTICISDFDTHAMARLPFARRKIRIIHNGFSPVDLFARGEARKKLFSSEEVAAHLDDTWVITNAEMHPNKNLFVALDTIAAFNTSHKSRIFYCIMGDGEQRRAIEKYIVDKNLADQVRLLGFVPNGRAYMRAFDIFFLPSKKEGVPYVLLEAGSAGLPIVASNVGGIPEVVTDGESGYLRAPDDIFGFTEALDKLAKDPTLRERMGKALERKIASDFSLSTMIDQTIRLY